MLAIGGVVVEGMRAGLQYTQVTVDGPIEKMVYNIGSSKQTAGKKLMPTACSVLFVVVVSWCQSNYKSKNGVKSFSVIIIYCRTGCTCKYAF